MSLLKFSLAFSLLYCSFSLASNVYDKRFEQQGNLSVHGEILGSACFLKHNLTEEILSLSNQGEETNDSTEYEREHPLIISLLGCSRPTLSHHHADIAFEYHDNTDGSAVRKLKLTIVNSTGSHILERGKYLSFPYAFTKKSLNYTLRLKSNREYLRTAQSHSSVRFRVNYN